MCGRVIQASPPDQLGLKIIDALNPRDNRVTGDPFGTCRPATTARRVVAWERQRNLAGAHLKWMFTTEN